MPSLEDAILLAVRAHSGQVDKSNQPYILHVLRVMLHVEGEEAQIAAVLHDVVEDTSYTLEDLRAMGYPDTVLTTIESLTRQSAESYEEFIARAGAHPIARRIKLADLEDNMDIRRLTAIGAKEAERLSRYVRSWRELRKIGPPKPF